MNIELLEKKENKYILLDLINTGAMAEVYKCKVSGKKGFEKIVALKKLLPRFNHDLVTIADFIDEAKLAGLFHHENIVQTYDFGESDDSYFITMEYLFGKDLYTVMQRAKGLSSSRTIEHALYITAKICEGMAYVHSLRDLQQRPQNIIHGDLSPHNVFITYEGKVKIIDFGSAKAEFFDDRSRMGIVKGKITYMSPEQLTSTQIDWRSDIFVIGILLYEMLSGRRMYSGDKATLLKKCKKAEHTKLENEVRDLPPAIGAMVEKALHLDKEQRYQSCSQLLADIEKCLFAINPQQSDQHLKKYICQLFSTEITREKSWRPGTSKPTTAGENEEIFNETLVPVNRRADFAADVGRRFGRFRPSVWFAGGSIAILLLLAWPILLYRTENDPIPEIASEPSQELAPAVAEVEISQEELEKPLFVPPTQKERMAKIKDLLDKAAQAWEEKRLTIPENDSAFLYYRNILAIDPKNDSAWQGIREIGKYYSDLAEQELGDNNFAEARQHVQKGLQVIPENRRLIALRNSISEKKKQFVENLSEKAERALQRNDLTTPPGDCAYEYYKKILQVDKQNSIALNGINTIAEKYVVLAEDAYRNMRITSCREIVRRGLAVAPRHPKLLELQKDLARSKTGIFFKSLEKSLKTIFQ